MLRHRSRAARNQGGGRLGRASLAGCWCWRTPGTLKVLAVLLAEAAVPLPTPATPSLGWPAALQPVVGAFCWLLLSGAEVRGLVVTF